MCALGTSLAAPCPGPAFFPVCHLFPLFVRPPPGAETPSFLPHGLWSLLIPTCQQLALSASLASWLKLVAWPAWPPSAAVQFQISRQCIWPRLGLPLTHCPVGCGQGMGLLWLQWGLGNRLSEEALLNMRALWAVDPQVCPVM